MSVTAAAGVSLSGSRGDFALAVTGKIPPAPFFEEGGMTWR